MKKRKKGREKPLQLLHSNRPARQSQSDAGVCLLALVGVVLWGLSSARRRGGGGVDGELWPNGAEAHAGGRALAAHLEVPLKGPRGVRPLRPPSPRGESFTPLRLYFKFKDELFTRMYFIPTGSHNGGIIDVNEQFPFPPADCAAWSQSPIRGAGRWRHVRSDL